MDPIRAEETCVLQWWACGCWSWAVTQRMRAGSGSAQTPTTTTSNSYVAQASVCCSGGPVAAGHDLERSQMQAGSGSAQTPTTTMWSSCACSSLTDLVNAAVVGLWLLVMGGHTADAGWFRQRTDTYHNDVVVLDRTGVVQWRTLAVGGDAPGPRELHSLTPLSGGRLLLFGGKHSYIYRSSPGHSEHSSLDRTGILQWRMLAVGGDAPSPKKLRSLTPLSGGRLLLFGGKHGYIGRSWRCLGHPEHSGLGRKSVVQWHTLVVGGDAATPRELHSLTPLSGGRLLLFGGARNCRACPCPRHLEPLGPGLHGHCATAHACCGCQCARTQ